MTVTIAAHRHGDVGGLDGKWSNSYRGRAGKSATDGQKRSEEDKQTTTLHGMILSAGQLSLSLMVGRL
jgi:hypothetical protein